MDMNRMTEKTQEALQSAQTITARFGHQQIDPEHLLLALLEQREGLVPRILTTMGVSAQEIQSSLEKHLAGMPQVSGTGAGQMYMSQRLGRLIDSAEKEARKLKDDYMSVEHLLLAVVDEGTSSPGGQILSQAGTSVLAMANDTAKTVTTANSNMAFIAYLVRSSLLISFRKTASDLLTEPDDFVSIPQFRLLVGGYYENTFMRFYDVTNKAFAFIIEISGRLI